MVVMLSTHRASRQAGETTLSTLSGETYNTTLSSNTRGSGGSRSTLHRTKEQITSVCLRRPKILLEQLFEESQRALTGAPSAPGDPFSPPGPGAPAAPASPGRPAGPVSPRAPLAPSLPTGPAGPGAPLAPWTHEEGSKVMMVSYTTLGWLLLLVM